MLNKNPYSASVPLVALESIHTQRPYSLIAMDFIKIFHANKRIRGRLIGAKSATKGAFRNKVLFDIHAVTNINLTAVAGCCAEIEEKTILQKLKTFVLSQVGK